MWDRLARAFKTSWPHLRPHEVRERGLSLFRAPGEGDKSWDRGAQTSCLIGVLYPGPSYETRPSGAGGGREGVGKEPLAPAVLGASTSLPQFPVLLGEAGSSH